MSSPIKAVLVSMLVNAPAVPFVFAPAPPSWLGRSIDLFFRPGESILVLVFGGTLDIQPFGLLFDLFVNIVLISAALWGGFVLWERRLVPPERGDWGRPGGEHR